MDPAEAASDARLLFGPGHVGDFAIVAAVDLEWLERFKAALAQTG